MLGATGKDIVANRARLSFGNKVKLLWNVYRDNGFLWTSHFCLYYLSSGIASASFDRLQHLKLEKKLPGTSGLNSNRGIWESWDWTGGGDEWTLSPEWKESLISNVLCRYVPKGGHILEIGPGAGRWTGILIDRADQFTAVDVAESCVRMCQTKFGTKPRTTFLVGNGEDLRGVADGSVDTLWSFGVFVHINIAETYRYMRDFRRVMRPGSVGIVHHGQSGGIDGGWQSNLTSSVFRDMLQEAGFEVVTQFETWKDERGEHPVGLYHDEITVFHLP
jgi:ubiquinone/menaquinone biosynthesis C-methylase UbiE